MWLSVAQHPGRTVSCTQAEALLLAAEARTGVRPLAALAMSFLADGDGVVVPIEVAEEVAKYAREIANGDRAAYWRL